MKSDTPKKYRLVELRAQNIKKLQAVAIKIDRSLFKITGKNEAGKSSVLDAVVMAIAGKDAFPAEPIRKGEDTAEIFLDFCDLKLTRKIWRREGGGFDHSVSLDFSDGKRPKEKQHVLDALRGSPIADDPIAFSRLKPKARYDMLRQLVADFNFAEEAAKRLQLFEDRRDIGRDFDKAKAAAESIIVPVDAPLVPVDVTELATQLNEAMQANALIDKRAQRREDAAEELEAMKDELDGLRAKVADLEGKIAAREEMIAQAEPLPEKANTDVISARIAGISALNNAAQKRLEKMQREAERDSFSEKYDSLSVQIKAIDDAKAQAIENAKFPVEGLTFGDDDILLDGLPFDQASTARKIRVSTSLLMAMKPDLRVLLVREGSLLDSDARAALEEQAKANDFVVLMECVGEGVDEGGVLIEDGQVAQ